MTTPEKPEPPCPFCFVPKDRVAFEDELTRALWDSFPVSPATCSSSYNIGLNVGKAAGQTVFHLHVHLIPRYEGDVPDPRGGVRHVIPGKGNYLTPEPGVEQKSRLLKGGENHPLLPDLSEELTRAQRADIAVGFAANLGLTPHLERFGPGAERCAARAVM